MKYEIGDYVKHVKHGRIGRVFRAHKNGDVEVTKSLNVETGEYYEGSSTWFRENLTPSTYDEWMATDIKYRRT